MSEWFVPSGVPQEGSTDTDEIIAGELKAIERSCNKLPSLTPSRVVFVNEGATALEAKSPLAAQNALGLIPFLSVAQTSAQAITSSTTLEDSALSLELEENSIYSIEFRGIYDYTTNGLLKQQLSYSGAFDSGYLFASVTYSSDNGAIDGGTSAYGEVGSPFTSTSSGDASDRLYIIRGIITTTNAGNLTLQFAQASSSVDETSLNFGILIAEKVVSIDE